jgi:uncharacterized damage-inducible protein DinB
MFHVAWRISIAIMVLSCLSAPARAQSVRPMAVPDLLEDVKQVHSKVVALANAIAAEKYDWRPAQGVRSVGEVFKHVIAANYLLPAAVGVPAPDATGIRANDNASAAAFEARPLDREPILAELEKSFSHVEMAMSDPRGRPSATVKLFGADKTVEQVWMFAVMHLHEHLGQLIAYARMNQIVPPWSK